MGLTTDRTEICLTEYLPSGQQKCYLVLSEAERAKGFTRPVRDGYWHKTCGRSTYMAQEIAETYARDPKFYGGTFCAHCGTHFDLLAFTDEPLDDADRAAGRVMHRSPQFFWMVAGAKSYLAVGD